MSLWCIYCLCVVCTGLCVLPLFGVYLYVRTDSSATGPLRRAMIKYDASQAKAMHARMRAAFEAQMASHKDSHALQAIQEDGEELGEFDEAHGGFGMSALDTGGLAPQDLVKGGFSPIRPPSGANMLNSPNLRSLRGGHLGGWRGVPSLRQSLVILTMHAYFCLFVALLLVR